jgi:hypothetical protein
MSDFYAKKSVDFKATPQQDDTLYRGLRLIETSAVHLSEVQRAGSRLDVPPLPRKLGLSLGFLEPRDRRKSRRQQRWLWIFHLCAFQKDVASSKMLPSLYRQNSYPSANVSVFPDAPFPSKLFPRERWMLLFPPLVFAAAYSWKNRLVLSTTILLLLKPR